jgi:hypothetical protein
MTIWRGPIPHTKYYLHSAKWFPLTLTEFNEWKMIVRDLVNGYDVAFWRGTLDFFCFNYFQPQWWGTTNLFAFSPDEADDAMLSNVAPVQLLSLPSTSASWSPLLSPKVAELVLLISNSSPPPHANVSPDDPTPTDWFFGCCFSSRCCGRFNPLLGGSSTGGNSI